MHFECAADIGAMTADERRLRQVLFSLVSNAINFTHEADAVTLGARRDGRHVVFTVSDTGVGIPESEQDLVMARFYRGSKKSGRRTGASAGLGLSLVRSFVELHGGTAELTSIPGQGTSVTCRVPADPVMAVARQSPSIKTSTAHAPRSLRRRKIRASKQISDGLWVDWRQWAV